VKHADLWAAGEGDGESVCPLKALDEVHPLRQAVMAAEAALAAAAAIVKVLQLDDTVEPEDPRWIAACDAEYAADEALITARQALRGSDCPRSWDLAEAGEVYRQTLASSAEQALDLARENFARDNYADDEGTLWIDLVVTCDETDECESVTIQSDAVEPPCTEAAHDWQRPYKLVGGSKENPGVWANGGGLIFKDVCLHCGCKKVTDTWASRPDNGRQGYTAVSYEPGAYSQAELEAFVAGS